MCGAERHPRSYLSRERAATLGVAFLDKNSRVVGHVRSTCGRIAVGMPEALHVANDEIGWIEHLRDTTGRGDVVDLRPYDDDGCGGAVPRRDGGRRPAEDRARCH